MAIATRRLMRSHRPGYLEEKPIGARIFIASRCLIILVHELPRRIRNYRGARGVIATERLMPSKRRDAYQADR